MYSRKILLLYFLYIILKMRSSNLAFMEDIFRQLNVYKYFCINCPPILLGKPSWYRNINKL